MSLPPVNNLTPDARRSRFVEEVRNHLEDAGSDAVGSPTLLIHDFNMYAKPRQRTRVAIVAAVAVITLLLPMLMFATAHAHGSLPWTGLIGVPSLLILLPIILPLGIINEVVGIPQFFEPIAGEIGVVLLASLFWTFIAYTLLFSPPAWLARKA